MGWIAIGLLFGFVKNPSVAGRVMALGGYGQPDERVRELLLAVDHDVLHNRALADATYAKLVERPEFRREFDTMANAVATFQQMFTEEVSNLLVRYTGEPANVDVALGGGCALNIVANAGLRQRLGRDIAIPPACNDSGHSVGAGVYALRYVLGQEVAPFSVYGNGRPEDASTSGSTLSGRGPATGSVTPRGDGRAQRAESR